MKALRGISGRKTALFFTAFLLAMPLGLFGRDALDEVDWDRIETQLYREMKAKGGKSDAEIHQAIGLGLLNAHNQWERATYHFQHAVKLDPELYWSWYNLGVIYIETEEGNEFFEKAVEAKPDFPPAYYWLAYNRVLAGKGEESIPLWEKYLEVAKSAEDEVARIKFAKNVLWELKAGIEGDRIKTIRGNMQ